MTSKYIPIKYAGREVGLEGRIRGLVLGSALLIMIPFYAVGEMMIRQQEKEKGRGYRGSMPRFNEVTDALKWCWSSAVKGRLPDYDPIREDVQKYQEKTGVLWRAK